MEKGVGYDNSVGRTNDGFDAATTVEMERVVVSNGTTTAKCCGSSNVHRGPSDERSSDTKMSANVCLPKCPAVRTSPWDPIKTQFAVLLTIAMVIWLLLGGIFVIKY